MERHFVGERIAPSAGTADASGMARGEPGLPREFSWSGTTYVVAEVLERWKTTGPCTSGADEQYVRRHWFRVRVESGEEMTLYFERQARSAREAKSRWWLYTVEGRTEK